MGVARPERGRYFGRVRLLTLALLLALGAGGSLRAADAARVIKVLPHFLDLQGRHSVSPSLFDRDAYQDQLRRNPEQRGGLRFDVHWKAPGASATNLALILQIRGSKLPADKPLVVEQPVRPRRFGTWTSVTLGPGTLAALGEPTAWRVTLWSGNERLAEQKSFLW
jgi:hypothetical protein